MRTLATWVCAASALISFGCGSDASLGSSDTNVQGNDAGSSGGSGGAEGTGGAGTTGGQSNTGGQGTAGASGSGGAAGTAGSTGTDAGDPCASVRCAEGTHCELVQVQCITTPCNPVPECVKDAPACGGFAGTPCPGAGLCVDDPGDDCDPNKGGADCPGLCHCNAMALCKAGTHWDDSANVCACVPDQPACASTTDCRLFDDYCGGCACDALPRSAPDPTCATPPVQCLRAPCQGLVEMCVDGVCKAVLPEL